MSLHPGMSPSQRHESPDDPNTLGPIFNVGARVFSSEFIHDNKRYFEWQVSPKDLIYSSVAGWSDLPYEEVPHELGSIGRLELPINLRNAGSVLSGVEAWEGEKSAVVRFMADYTKKVYQQFGSVDVGMVLDTVGVSRRGEIKLVMPPHEPTVDPHAIGSWLSELRIDMEAVLINEPGRDELFRIFEEGTSFLGAINHEA